MAFCEQCGARLEDEGLPAPLFDEDRRVVHGAAGAWCRLTGTQWELVKILWRRRGKLVTKDSLCQLLWGNELDPPGDKTLDVHICKLRKALAPIAPPFAVDTIWGTGYTLVVGPTMVRPRG